ncbi:tetratricopeptide repeat protein [Solirubrobacter sp. CPCC 204708]|uniref:Tetratricopeptide repeat protein n=1 Tax=Solirubrobacter deserti TaxID=2282478 RepID=A0ABT4RH44_9ACTN|nr:tetratricopeptide repeat protein [Solirubrobacter deserti]MBE2315170.1 tetratricopeptide repeat protein [Solirubrobacter deserti]MDA0137853.1 tetratricopeptide repeat protein [Solirubrobacter deserti]
MPSAADALFARAYAADGAGRFEDAEPLYREAAAAGHATAAYNLAELLTRLPGRAADAEAACHAAVAAGDPDGWWLLGWLLEDLDGRDADAEHAWREAVAAGSRGARTALGRFLAARRRLDEAGEELERALEDDVDALYGLGAVREQQGREGEAELLYRRAINAGNTDAVGALGELLAGQRRVQEAEGRLRAAVEAGEAQHLLTLYGVLVGAGRADEIEGLGGDSMEARVLIATHLMDRAGREEDAEAALRALIDDGHGFHRHLGDLLARQPGREDDAEAAYRAALADGARHTERRLGRLLARIPGREADAEVALRAALAEYEHGDVEPFATDHVRLGSERGGELARSDMLARVWRQLGELLARLPGREADAQAAFRAAEGR